MENKKKKTAVKKAATGKKAVKRSVSKVKRSTVAKKKPVAAAAEVRLIGLEGLHPPVGAHKPKKLLGRGPSSGHGKTSTRGSKGQTSRAGRDFYAGFEGGQTPLIRRIPKRGFTSRSVKLAPQIVNLTDLARIKATTITPVELEAANLIKDKNKPVKILGVGEVGRALEVKAQAFSKKAQSTIIAAGGKIELINA